MPPIAAETTENINTSVLEGVYELKNDINEENGEAKNKILFAKDIGTDLNYKREIVWLNVFLIGGLHMFGLIGAYFVLTGQVSLITIVFGVAWVWTTAKGVIIGAHRLYSHKCFKAHPLLRAALLVLHTQAGQNCLYIWVRDHRLHHRFSDTDADPHNASRGFFFSHVGWLMTKKHPMVKEMGKTTDMSDLEADWMVMFQKEHYYKLYFIFGVLVPMGLPYFVFGETLFTTFCTTFCLRYIYELNMTWLVNSAAHLYGTRPYDRRIKPVENWFVSFMTTGEGWHNYHHAFPWDYKAAELPTLFNQSARVIQWFAKHGWVWDLKSASEEMIVNRIKNHGDNTHFKYGDEEVKKQVTAIGPVHPFNPTYNSTLELLTPIQFPEYLYYNKDAKCR